MKMISIGSVTTLTLGSAGGDSEGQGRRWGWKSPRKVAHPSLVKLGKTTSLTMGMGAFRDEGCHRPYALGKHGENT